MSTCLRLLVVVGVALPARALAETTPVTVFLDSAGATLSAGVDDSDSRVSSLLVTRAIDSLAVPAYSGSAADWRATASCVAEGFAGFAIEVTDQRPAAASYITVMVGGRPAMLGYDDGYSGVAPYTGAVMADAIAFVFADQIGNRVDAVCQSILHEVGHTLGLDHSHHCSDVMSYLYGCGARTFTDADLSCGELAPRQCANGEASQNSYRHLADAVGLRGPPIDVAPPLDPSPPIDLELTNPASSADWGDAPGEDWQVDSWNVEPEVTRDEAPTVAVVSADVGRMANGDRFVDIIVWASDDHGVASVDLGWATPHATHLLSCAGMPDDIAAVCVRDGDYYIFTLMVGLGERAFAVRVSDAGGQEAVTEPQELTID